MQQFPTAVTCFRNNTTGDDMQQFPTAVTCFRNNTTGDDMQQFPTAVTCPQVWIFRELPIIVG
ncbi:hypothetical protein DPMN_112984 [Dreissena polymorpha]|uniref:Uncharacterized protein n=1 Tax=Dreissena polymorpha TaxID=45954 RepID=A0A9D4QR59_DREPO|nr:hypothetical protein DPMN_112984 [Dreissena polymorpha]